MSRAQTYWSLEFVQKIKSEMVGGACHFVQVGSGAHLGQAPGCVSHNRTEALSRILYRPSFSFLPNFCVC